MPDVIDRRVQASKDVHASALKSVASQPDLISDLRNISDIAGFMANETSGAIGTRILAKYLPRVFAAEGQRLPMRNDSLAQVLLTFKCNKVAHALTQNDIYGTWRAARSEALTLPKSVPDDAYHVVNAAYCDVFVTADRDGQAPTAEHVLPGINALVYRDEGEPLLDWLEQRLS